MKRTEQQRKCKFLFIYLLIVNQKINVIDTAKRILEETNTNSVIVEDVVFSGKRRERTFWSQEEVDNLTDGVKRHGSGQWAAILNDKKYKFRPGRTTKDLKDKWRNLTCYQKYNLRPIRHYLLVDEFHRPILTDKGRHRIFRNRYPRDAALKVTSKDEFYTNDKTNIDIYLQDMDDEGRNTVHVYRGTRHKSLAVDIPKFAGKKSIWIPHVEKLREEKLYSKEIFE